MAKPTPQEIDSAVWAYIAAEKFAEAEVGVRSLIDQADTDSAQHLWHLYGLLGSILNSLKRPTDAWHALRTARNYAELGGTPSLCDVSRYMLANQHLSYGASEDALAEAEPVPPGVGHVQCLLHAIVAKANLKLSRADVARTAALDAFAAAPSDERRAELVADLADLLGDSP